MATLGKIRYVKNHSTNQWELDDDFYNDGGNLSGLSITGDRKKMYFSQWSPSWSESEKKGPELCVSYWDTLNKNWEETYFLNINSERIPLDDFWNKTVGGGDANPWITENGKILYFSSSRNINWADSTSHRAIYVSYLLVDENGDTVTSVSKEENLIVDFSMEQNYPNPFNPTTTINYTLNKRGFVKLILYDSHGKRITELFKQTRNKGNYKYTFNAWEFNLSSGVYYYQLFLDGNYIVKKMQYVK